MMYKGSDTIQYRGAKCRRSLRYILGLELPHRLVRRRRVVVGDLREDLFDVACGLIGQLLQIRQPETKR